MKGAAKIFLLSPANARGKRAQMVIRREARFDLAIRLRERGAPIGEVFSFMSGLYFRGKWIYAQTFARPPGGLSGAFVITARLGLVPAETVVTLADLELLSGGAVDAGDSHYVRALTRDAQRLAHASGPHCSMILLGSVATAKYLVPLRAVFGTRLNFPLDFIGRGDLSRGGLLLRAARDGRELNYGPVGETTHHGRRPAKLKKEIPE